MPTFTLKQTSLLAHKIRYGDLYGEDEQPDWVQEFFEEDGVIVTPSEDLEGRGREGVMVHSTGEFISMGAWLCRTPGGEYLGLTDALLTELATLR